MRETDKNNREVFGGHISEMEKEAEKIQEEVRSNEPNQTTNNDGTVDESALMEMDYGYDNDHEDDFDIG